MKITATIIAQNEAEHIRLACQSVSWADEIVVVDSGSTDDTRKIATECGARVIENAWPGFAAQKEFAAQQASHEWILSLDADERVSDELKTSILSIRQMDETQPADGYSIARRAFYMGRWIRGGGWYPDRQLRLYRKTRGHWAGPHVHESVQMDTDARVEMLCGDILHYPGSDATEHHRLIGERYAPLAARQMFEQGRRTSKVKIGTIGPLVFVRSFILKAGFRDGLAGFSIAWFAAHNAFLKHLMLWELQRDSQQSDE